MLVSSLHWDGPAPCILYKVSAVVADWDYLSTHMQQKSHGKCAALESQLLTQEDAAARLQAEMGGLQQQLSTERNLMVEAQSTISTTQVSWFPTLCSHLCLSLPSFACIVSVFPPASTLT